MRKIVVIFSILTFWALFCSFSIVVAQESFISDLVKVESIVYGEPQSGAVLERLNKIENLLFGRTLPGTVAERQKRLVEFVLNGMEGDYPLTFKISSLEWLVLQEVTSGPLANRIDKLEELILGERRADKPVAWRVENLMKLCVPTGEIKMEDVELPKGQLIKVSLLTPMDSRNNKPKDEVKFRVVEDLVFENVLVIPRGAIGVGEIVKVERAGAFGKTGKIEVRFKYVESIAGQKIPVYVGERAAEETKKEVESRAWAAITSFVGLGVFGPVGLVAGAFVHGAEAKIPAGTKFYLEVSEDVSVKGLATSFLKEEGKEPSEVEKEGGEETKVEKESQP
ncbi:MAG: TrbI/VirB10 family protein [Synergistetes bacterium]|nr:MAG: Uncharacterized protein XD52_1244 [bacterium 42_11]MBC7331740.1 TrbI/VirB10 family protein [Synergistota bacterium]MDK2871329.1 hypothetical protein [bacterium]